MSDYYNNPPDPPDDCDLRGLDATDCTCPPCEICGDNGCLTHLDDTEILARERQAWRLAAAMKRELERRDRETPLKCQTCGTVIPRERMDCGDPCPCWLIPEGVGGIDLSDDMRE